MRILMMTNTYKPYTGGVGRSIEYFTENFRRRGHSVLIVAPEPEEKIEDEADVFRVSSIKNFNDTNFPVTIPLPGELSRRVEHFQPDIVHLHFPFIIGSAAVRVAANYDIPLVFTHHTMYEQYIHYINSDSDRVREFVKKLTTGYANLCDLVIAPSQAVKQAISDRGVTTRIEVIPTGIDIEKMKDADGQKFREKLGIPAESFVVGHLGRLAKEKNLMFLCQAAAEFLRKNKDVYFIAAGDGQMRQEMENFFKREDLQAQTLFPGLLKGQDVADAYHAMDVFVFSSQTETQGMVLAEAMSAGLPVIALKAAGVDEILRDGSNGYMLDEADIQAFAERIERIYHASKPEKEVMKQKALETAGYYSIDLCAERVLNVYQQLIDSNYKPKKKDEALWQNMADLLKAEWDIFRHYVSAVKKMVAEKKSKKG